MPQRPQYEESGNARLAGAFPHDLESLSIALQGKGIEVFVVERATAPPEDHLAGDNTAISKTHPFECSIT